MRFFTLLGKLNFSLVASLIITATGTIIIWATFVAQITGNTFESWAMTNISGSIGMLLIIVGGANGMCRLGVFDDEKK